MIDLQQPRSALPQLEDEQRCGDRMDALPLRDSEAPVRLADPAQLGTAS